MSTTHGMRLVDGIARFHADGETSVTGTIPSEFGKLTSLTSLRILHNHLLSPSAIPGELEALTALTTRMLELP